MTNLLTGVYFNDEITSMIAGRFMHTMLHVADLDRSIDFYTSVMGMKVLRRGDRPAERRQNAFVGYGSEAETAVIELTSYDNRDRYAHGDAFGHIAIGCEDVRTACAFVKENGGDVWKAPYNSNSGKLIAFIRDPDGYEIELIGVSPGARRA